MLQPVASLRPAASCSGVSSWQNSRRRRVAQECARNASSSAPFTGVSISAANRARPPISAPTSAARAHPPNWSQKARGGLATPRVKSRDLPAALHPARFAALHQSAPSPHFDIHAESARGLSDPPPRAVALGIRHAFDLVESGHRIAHVARVVDRLLALTRECEHLTWHAVTTLRAKSAAHMDLLVQGYRSASTPNQGNANGRPLTYRFRVAKRSGSRG